MKPSLRYTLAGLFLSPALALAQAPIVPLSADAPLPIRAVRGQAPAPMPMPMSTAPVVPATPAVSPVPAPAVAMPDPAKAADCPTAGCPAEEPKKEEEKFLLEKLLANCPAAKTLGDNGWRIYGWTQGSYNASSASRSNLPVPFIDRANEFSLMQNWLHVEKTIDTSKKEFQIGGVADLILPGTDARFTIARGLLDSQLRRGELYPIDLFQAYTDVYLPGLAENGTTLRVGKFATFLEYEVVQGISNPFLSRSYNFQYNPFTHTGVMAINTIGDWTLSNGVVLGNDNFIDPASRPTYIGQAKWAPKDGCNTVALGVSVTDPRYNAAEAFAFYNVYNLQVTHKFSDKLQYVLDATYSHIYDVPGIGFANWYGFVNYLLYQWTDKLASNSRVELFTDAQGFRTGSRGLYTAVTQGFTWKPQPWLYVMPEVRYDYAARSRPFEGDHDLFTAAIGFIVRW